MKKAKSILFRVELEGNGVVNYDNTKQKYMNTENRLKGHKGFDNVAYAKKNYYRGENGEVDFKLKISSDCIRHGIFVKDMVAQSPNIIHNPLFLMTYIASPMSILRGYMFAGSETIKRKSPITLVDAEEISNTISNIELFSKSGEKDDKGLFFKETVGNITYATVGNINLNELQFVSTDTVFDRLAFNPDNFQTYKSLLNSQIGNFNSELGYYTMANSISEVPEKGFKLSDENVVFLTKEFFKRLFVLDISRSRAYAKLAKLEYKFVYDVAEDTFNNPTGWQSILNLKDIENIDFVPEEAYILVDKEIAEKQRADLLILKEVKEKASKDAKAEAKEAKSKYSKTKTTTVEDGE